MRARLSRRVLPVLLLVWCSLFSLTSPTTAADPGDLGIYGDAAGNLDTIQALGFTPFDVYVLTFDPPGGLKGFEIGVDLPPGFLQLGYDLIENPIIILPPGNGDWILSLSNCYQQPVVNLLRLTLGYFQGPDVPPDALVCLRATVPSTLPGTPAYLDCDGNVRPFGVAQDGGGLYPDACLVINPTNDCQGGYEYDLAMPEGRGPGGTQVVVPITVNERFVAKDRAKCTIVPGSYEGVRLELEWNPAVASWVGATLAPGQEDWSLTTEILGDGHVRMTAINPTPDPFGLGFLSGTDLFLPVFELIDGSTPLTTSNEALLRSFDGSDRPLNGTISLLTTQPIATESSTFSALKARFGQN